MCLRNEAASAHMPAYAPYPVGSLLAPKLQRLLVSKLKRLLVPKLQLGNAILCEAPASRFAVQE